MRHRTVFVKATIERLSNTASLWVATCLYRFDYQAFRRALFDHLLQSRSIASARYLLCCFKRWFRRTLGVRSQHRSRLRLQFLGLWRSATKGATANFFSAKEILLMLFRQQAAVASAQDYHSQTIRVEMLLQVSAIAFTRCSVSSHSLHTRSHVPIPRAHA